MQLDRFVWGMLPLCAMICFSCGGSTSSVGGLVQTGAAGAGSQPGVGGAAGTGGVSGSGGAPGAGGGWRRAIPGLRRHLRPGEPADLRLRHQRRPDGRAGRRVPQPHGARERHRVRHLSPDHLSPQQRDGHERRDQAARPIVLGADGHARRRPRKMQFDVSFDQIDPMGSFHGVSKLVFDMPRDDWTFMHDRISQAWLRQDGIMAPCSVNARLDINGATTASTPSSRGWGTTR